MASLKTRTSTSNTLGGEYQVFLSFRGSDTRHGFTNCLYHALVDAGIHVFIDHEELQPGERISDELLQALNDSKLYIPIFSKNYASSHWCLHELAKMVENSKSTEDGKVILPIFYDVKPNDVKLKTMLYSKAISNLKEKMEDEKKFSLEDVETWQQALKEVDDTKGWELEKYSSNYGDLIKEVVNVVMVKLQTRQRQVPKNLIEMEDRMAAIDNLLDMDSDGVLLIVICGMGGIGKTTLAKVIFNKLYDRFGKNCSFLGDVRETAKKKKGLVKLQKKLLSDISYSKVARKIDDTFHGMNRIGETIRNKKMLIVLDDVEEGRQIENLIGVNSLSPGTRILVTTRDKSIMNNVEFKYGFKHYEMEGLSDGDALRLFSRHAFNDNAPPANYYNLSKDIVHTANGLPLALEVIGSYLNKKKKEIWQEWLKKLRETSHHDVLAKLRISYDALKPDQQQIFLDIACFFIGQNKTNPIYVWEDCNFCPEDAIEVLTRRCMIKVLDDDRFWMHDQIKDLGRTIVKEENTRLWDTYDIICKLRSTKKKKRVQALRLRSRDSPEPPLTITSEQIKRFPNIRFLWLYEVICQGGFTGCLSELRWISLDYNYPSPATADHHHQQFEATNSLRLENVVVVNLSGVDITEDVFKSLIKGARKLKVLTLCYNTLIHGTPTFPQNSGLEKLTISKFLSLEEIHPSIRKLTKLTDLSFELCVELEKLPEQIGDLRKLQHLSLRSCDSLRELPDSILKLTSLTKLDVWGTRITRLPDSIIRLSSLSSVNASFTSIGKLPSTMNKLLCLRTLHLKNCNQIQELPELPKSLTTLQLTSTTLVTVPNLSYLTNLVELALSDGSEYVAKSDIIQTCDLQWIGSLSRLSKLQFCFSNVCVSTIELGSLSLLKELILHGIDVPAFKQLPSKLMVLRLYDTQGKHIRLPPLEKETAIVSSSSRELGENKVLRQIKIESIEDHKSSDGWVHLRDEPGCNELQAPKLFDHWRGAFHLPGSLNMLQKFVLWGCPGVQDIQFVSTLESMLVFSIGGCSSLKRLCGLSNLKNLMELTLNRCWILQVVEGIDELEFLHQLKIDRCTLVEMVLDPSSSKIPDKCSIRITHSGNLTDSGETSNTWESYREKILNGTEIETAGSETETRDKETGDAQPSFFIIPPGSSVFGLENSETETGDARMHLSSVVTVPEGSSIYETTDTETETETETEEDFAFYN